MADQNQQDYLMRRVSAMETERYSFMPHWQEISKFIQPRRGRFLIDDRNKGDKRYQAIINSAATKSVKIATSGMLAGVMSPSRPWFAFRTPDPDMMEFAPVKNWLYDVELLFRAIFDNGNLYTMAPTLLGELLLFGTGSMLHVDDFEDVGRFYVNTVGSYFVEQDHRRVINVHGRQFMMTPPQMIGDFGIENVSKPVKDAYDRGNYGSWFPVTHLIEPNSMFDGDGTFNVKKAFRSIYFEPGNTNKDQLLRKSGFDEFPVYVPRWDVTGEDVYGTDCPGMITLGDVKQLQMQERRKGQAIDKMSNPPLKGPAELRGRPVTPHMPGGLTVYDQTGNSQGLSPVYQVDPRIGELKLDMDGVVRRIESNFFVDMFLAITNMEGIQPRNEFDLAQRNQERLLQLGPVLQHIHKEWLDKLIDRQFNQAIRAGILPPHPPELDEVPLRVEYISTLAMAQRAVATDGIDRLTGYVKALVVDMGRTDVLDKFDADQAVDEYASAIGVPPRLVVPDDKVAEVRAQRQAQQQQAVQAEQAATLAKAARDAAGAGTADKNLLTDIAGATAGNAR